MDYLHSNTYIARFSNDGKIQNLDAHSQNVALLAYRFAKSLGLEKLGKKCGDKHDYGKELPDFQAYITSQLYGINDKIKSSPHSIYGAKAVYNEHKSCPPIAEILSNCIISHHGSLKDFLTPDGEPQLLDDLTVLNKDIPPQDENKAETDELLTQLKGALNKSPDKAFAISMITKFLYSCLIDADRLDAYLFENEAAYSPEPPDWQMLLSNLEAHIAGLAAQNNNADPEMSALRERVSSQCASSGLRERGIYQLSAPTGSGKTLSGMRFALTHAKIHNMDRIIYVIPYLSILDQAADVIRGAVRATDDIILEHHSNFIPDDPEFYKFRTGRWEEPIILTTQVQFLESIFSAKGSDLRKFHNITNSVIIFDEIQSLPVKCVNLFNSVINFLNKVCGCTVVLCTATQPLLDKAAKIKLLLSDKPSIIDGFVAPERTKIQSILSLSGYSYSELAVIILLKHNVSTLVIVNTKAAAKELAIHLRNNGVAVLHLSTNMCHAHRDIVIKQIKEHLVNKIPFICVSTNLIEAGVDLSFECVFRDIAGLDNIYQAAGRCNRHGEYGCVKNVYVFNLKNENLNKLPDIKIGADITRRLLADDIEDINEYYRHYFFARQNIMDFPANGGTILDLLTNNQQGHNALNNKSKGIAPELRGALRSAADAFYVIAPGQTDVIVPYCNSSDCFDEFISTDDLKAKSVLLKRLGSFTVSLFGFQISALTKSGAIDNQNGFLRLADGFYDSEFGVDINGNHEFLCI